jgi:phosphoribosylanthranilate isomerase
VRQVKVAQGIATAAGVAEVAVATVKVMATLMSQEIVAQMAPTRVQIHPMKAPQLIAADDVG